MKFSDSEAREACRLLGIYTSNRFDVWILAGSQKASCRAHIMSALMGRKMPQAKSGVNAIRNELFKRLDVQGGCDASRDDEFISGCRREFGQPDVNRGGSVL